MIKDEYPLFIFPYAPVAKPRQTQRDRWGTNKRKSVERYHEFRDKFRVTMNLQGFYVDPDLGIRLKLYMPMPTKSWSKKKKGYMEKMPHKQRPDIDNLEKGILDALYEDDSKVWNLWTSKYWTDSEGSFTIQNFDE